MLFFLSLQGLGHIFELAISLSLEMWHGVRVYPPGSVSSHCGSGPDVRSSPVDLIFVRCWDYGTV